MTMLLKSIEVLLLVLAVSVLVFTQRVHGFSKDFISPTSTLTTASLSSFSTQTTSKSVTPTVTPSPSHSFSLNTYVLDSTDSKPGEERVCLRMVSKMAVNFQYTTTDGKLLSKSVLFDETARMNRNKSSCGLSFCAEPTSATLTIDFDGLSVALSFNELEGNKHWSYNSTTVSYTVSRDLFPNIRPDLYGTSIRASSDASLFDWTLLQLILGTSYACITNTTLEKFNNSVVGDSIKVSSVVFSELQVQAFRFVSQSSFDNDYESCVADRQIVVPVAVAGALALLTSGVLLFSLTKFIVRKYKERKRSREYNRLVNEHL